MSPLLTLGYWFSLTPAPFMPWVERALLIGFGAFFIGGIMVWVIQMRGGQGKYVKRALGRAASLLAWTGLVGLFLWAAEYEQIPFLTIRFVYIVWLAWVIAWAWFIVRYMWVEVPALEARNKERTEREKWLPKRK
jgi:hypothetical protein